MTIKELKALAIGKHKVCVQHIEGVLTVEEHNHQIYKERFFKFDGEGEFLLLKISENNQLYIKVLVCGLVLQENIIEDDVFLISN